MDQNGNGLHWFNAPKDQLHSSVFQYINYLDSSQSYRSADNLRYARLYGNYDLAGLDAYSYSRIETSMNVSHRVTFNLIQSCVDTIVSKITKNKPRPMFLTSGGDWTAQQKAKKLNKYVEGIFHDSDFYEQATKAFTDACIFGTGCIKFYSENENIKAERVFIEEIKMDDVECFYGKPRQIHQIKWLTKEVIKEMFPGNDLKIDASTTTENGYSSMVTNARAKDLIMVVESWKLPSTKDAKDGVHSITTSNVTLFEERWEKSYFPFVFFKWSSLPVGFFGQGLAEQLQGIQLEINKILRTIQVSMHLVSIPKIFVEASSKIVSAHLNNKIGGIVKFAGTPPTPAPLGNIPGELFSHLDNLINKGYQVSGISQLSATSQKPSGLNSGRAMRIYNDLETERFQTVARHYEDAVVDAARVIVDMSRDLYADRPELSVNVKGRKFIESIKWEDVDLEDDKYILSTFPTSALSQTPSGRLEDVQELIQAGFISREDGMKLLDFPDLEAVTRFYNAPLEDIEKMIDRMMETGEYEPPEPYQNLAEGIKKCQLAYLYFKTQNAPEENLELLRTWMSDAEELLATATQKAAQEQAALQAAAQPQAMVPGVVTPQAGEPLAAPEAVPTSDLVQNLPGAPIA